MITQSQLQSILNYDSKTGIFTRKIKTNFKQKVNEICGTKHPNGYVYIQLENKKYRAHRLAWLYVYGEFPIDMIDHINGDVYDNRICNLRLATKHQNQYNAKLRSDNTSGIKGVSWNKNAGKWQVNINVNGKTKYIGCFEDKELAELVIKEIRNKYHKEFSNHGE